MYTEEELLREIKELMGDDELYKLYERTFKKYHYYFDTIKNKTTKAKSFNYLWVQ